jgi:hypothetical protein
MGIFCKFLGIKSTFHRMTSSAAAAAAAAAELAKALSQSKSDEICGLFEEFADFCRIPVTVVNKLTMTDFSDFNRVKKLWNSYFSVIKQSIASLLHSLAEIENKNKKEMFIYIDLSILQNSFVFFDSCDTPEKMLQWVRGFSALDSVESAMKEFALDEARKADASESKLYKISNKKRVFCGNITMWHQIRRKQPWDDGSKITLNLGALHHQINMMAKWAGVKQGKNQEVEDLLFEARLANLREDPLKLTGIDRLVQAFADEAARNFLAKLAPAGALALKKN